MNMKKIFTSIALSMAVLLGNSQLANAERIKDIANLQGVRNNQLVGYGLVVGLDGSGDQTTQTPFTAQSIGNMLAQMGINMTPAEAKKLQLKNVAAVMVTANLPAFAQPGQVLDVNVASIGNAKNLSGGMLVLTPLKGADGNVYAMAQGNLVLGQEGVYPGGARVTPSNKASARIPGGATVERSVPTNVGQNGVVFYELTSTDFATAERLTTAINKKFGTVAQAVDARRIAVKVPTNSHDRVSFLGRLENLEVSPNQALAKVVINPRTGSVVMNQRVQLEPCAIAHGNLSVVVDDRSTTLGKDVSISYVKTGKEDEPGDLKTTDTMMNVPQGANLADVVKALNALGASPADLVAILQAMKAAGSLRAELEII